jgi:hypothetical protein
MKSNTYALSLAATLIVGIILGHIALPASNAGSVRMAPLGGQGGSKSISTTKGPSCSSDKVNTGNGCVPSDSNTGQDILYCISHGTDADTCQKNFQACYAEHHHNSAEAGKCIRAVVDYPVLSPIQAN